MDDQPDNVIPLPSINRDPEPIPLDGEVFVTYLRRVEQEPWIVTSKEDGRPMAVEVTVGHPIFRIRLDLRGEYRGLVRVFVLLDEVKRGRLAMFGRPEGDNDDVFNALREGLRFLRRDVADSVMRATRKVAG